MKELLGCIRKADKDFGLIEAGDRVCVGVSGGKDSLALLYAMSLYRRFCPTKYELVAATLHMGREPFDLSGIQALCQELDVPYVVKRTQIAEVIFDIRKESNPCALCAKMRRGALTDLCKDLGANKLALGHHRDDAEETLLMSMLYEGRIHTFHPKTFLSRSGITQIRPMVYCSEKHIIHVAKTLDLPVVKSPCPANGFTKREEIKQLLNDICKKVPNARELLLSALQNEEQYGLWNKK
ncbi:MAG: tRNA 2-thiocytidine biosynthesis protein TtcA [Clostridia bacterium]|nr:tRNA 2-thiocytidine biosynthesis protein TtcA [Clostridia bacterium]